jgi:hypothetical protein
MIDRSSNGTHWGGDGSFGVESSHGVRIGGGSTGGTITAIGDDANISLTIAPKGTGTLTLGNSSTPISIGRRFTVEFTPPALAASTSAESTYTVTGLTTGAVIVLTPRAGLSPAYTTRARCSTANELVVAWGNLFGSTIGTGESTNRWTVLAL